MIGGGLVGVSKLMGKHVRANITLPERVLAIVDEAAKREGDTRSGFLVRAALGYAGYGAVPRLMDNRPEVSRFEDVISGEDEFLCRMSFESAWS